MKLFPASAIRKIDRYTIEKEPISSIDLMERAASLFTLKLTKRWEKSTRFVVFAGHGNNGGDALVIARRLAELGYKVECYLFNPTEKLSEDCQTNRDRARRTPGVAFYEISSNFNPPMLNSQTVVIDGLFGTGLSKPLSGGFASVVQYINESDATVVSIDIPSGLYSEDNRDNSPKNIIRAHYTYTFQFPKLAFLLCDNAEFVGEWEVIDIGLHPDALRQTTSNIHYTTREEVRQLIRERRKFDHKGVYGHALLVAGSYGMMGAATLAAEASLRTGVGRITLHTPKCGYTIAQTAVPEAMVCVDKLEDRMSWVEDPTDYTAVGIGPGLRCAEETAEGLERLLKAINSPCVIDADALNLLARHREMIHEIPAGSILTPHPGELTRLAGEKECQSGYDRLAKAYELAKQWEVYIVLKGAYTAIVTPDGECFFNSTGNAGMATAGSGDVLTGMITSLLAQGYPPKIAAIVGVYLHGLAGDLTLSDQSKESLLAHDIIAHIGKAFHQLKQK